jgi:hypothetical protein
MSKLIKSKVPSSLASTPIPTDPGSHNHARRRVALRHTLRQPKVGPEWDLTAFGRRTERKSVSSFAAS